MNPLQQHIVDSLVTFDKEEENIRPILANLFEIISNNQRKDEDNSIDFNKAKPQIIELLTIYKKQSQLQLLEVIRGEVENLHSFETEDFIFPPAVKRQDVLDLLTIKEN